jgi:[acyl-carrier-protein] S-malonyltransferase
MKTVELAVAGAFHSPLMQPAADALSSALENTNINFSETPAVIANYNADFYKSAEQVKEGLCVQLTGSVLWQKSMETLLTDGVEDFCEIGPGRVLTGLMKKIKRKTKVTNLSTADALTAFIGTDE